MAEAHTRTTTISRIDLVGTDVQWALRVRLFDLLAPLELSEHTPPATVLSQSAAAAAYLLPRLGVTADRISCEGRLRGARLVPDAPEPTAEFDLAFACPAAGSAVRLDYRLFFDLDPLHTGFASLAMDGQSVASHVFRAGTPEIALDRPRSSWQNVTQYLALGVEHIFLGYDHLAFLAALLLGVVLSRRGAGPDVAPAASATRAAIVATLKLVTAFTVAHSITLLVAALRPALVPTGWVEPVIALSVAYVAIENLRRRLPRRRWLIAFSFGLVHGFGFASVLQEIGLPQRGLVASLLAFNVGVEIGQVTVVACCLPLMLWAAHRSPATFERWVLQLGSTALGLAGLVWFVSRVGGW